MWQRLAFLLLVGAGAGADELIYTPVNPAFGGSPLNGNWMLSNAQVQDDYEDEAALEDEPSNLEEFNRVLQRAILSRLASAVASSFLTEDNELKPTTQPVDTGDFLIEITDTGNGTLLITTKDKVTGETTSFEIDSRI